MQKIVIKEIDGVFTPEGMVSEYLIYKVIDGTNVGAYIVQGEEEKQIRVEAIKLSFTNNNEDILIEEVNYSEYLNQTNK